MINYESLDKFFVKLIKSFLKIAGSILPSNTVQPIINKIPITVKRVTLFMIS